MLFSAAVNRSSLQLVSCWLYFRHLFPVLPDSPIDSKKHFSCFFIRSCYITLPPLCCTEDSVQRLALIFNFSVLVFLHESSIKMRDHINILPENRTHGRIPSTVYFYKYDALKQINSLYSPMVSMHFSFLQVYEHKGIDYYSLTKTREYSGRDFCTHLILNIFRSI